MDFDKIPHEYKHLDFLYYNDVSQLRLLNQLLEKSIKFQLCNCEIEGTFHIDIDLRYIKFNFRHKAVLFIEQLDRTFDVILIYPTSTWMDTLLPKDFVSKRIYLNIDLTIYNRDYKIKQLLQYDKSQF